MNNKIIIAIVIVAVIAVGGYLLYTSGPVVSAQGVSTQKIQPDEVSVNIQVLTKNISTQDAQEMNKQISEKLIDELVKAGFSRDELKFVNYNVYQEYDYYGSQTKNRPFVVSQELVVKTKNVTRVPSVVDATINAGALVSYINFELSQEKENEYKMKALEAASKDARDKAASIASGQGKSLGALVSITNQEFNPGYPIPYYANDMAKGGVAQAEEARSAAINIAPQDMEVTASVSAQYRLRLI